jgi:(p)ppGpp synthase/HD superfamily hydrolase
MAQQAVKLDRGPVDPEREREFEKAVNAMRHWLGGRASASRFEKDIPTPWSVAQEAFEFALSTHVGRRKNGDPEMIHQLRIGHCLRTLEWGLLDAPLAIACAMLHDIREDYGISRADIRLRFGALVDEKVELLTKESDGVKKSDLLYYAGLSGDAIAAIVKAADRFHNHSTMGEAFSIDKQLSYMIETEEFVLPMIKEATRKFPVQEPAFENLKLSLLSQITLARPTLEMAKQLADRLGQLKSESPRQGPAPLPAKAPAP